MSCNELFVWLTCDVDMAEAFLSSIENAANQLIERRSDLGYETAGISISSDIDVDALFECSGDSMDENTVQALKSAKTEIVIPNWLPLTNNPLQVSMLRALLQKPEVKLVSSILGYNVTYETPQEFLATVSSLPDAGNITI